MYSLRLQDYVAALAHEANMDAQTIDLLGQSAACFLGVLGRAIGGETLPTGDILSLSIRLLLIDDALSELSTSSDTDGLHYLVGMGFEQTGELLARLTTYVDDESRQEEPINNERWYRLCLAYLHYLAGGHRLQARSVLHTLEYIADNVVESRISQYKQFNKRLLELYSSAGNNTSEPHSGTGNAPNGATDITLRRIRRLVMKIRERENQFLIDLGWGQAKKWLEERNITDQASSDYWQAYLLNLKQRGIPAYTQEHLGSTIDDWLLKDSDLLVTLPSSIERSFISQLRTAVALLAGQDVIWLVAATSNARQIRAELELALRGLDVSINGSIEEATGFLDGENIPKITVLTPERAKQTLETNAAAVNKVGLVVLDEAQMLTMTSRFFVVESLLRQLTETSPDCNFVFSTSQREEQARLTTFIQRLTKRARLSVLNTEANLTRRIYGVLTEKENGINLHPHIILYPPGIQQVNSAVAKAPISLLLHTTTIPKSTMGATMIAQRLIRNTNLAGLRTVLFVGRKDSVETQAREISQSHLKGTKDLYELPHADTARIEFELGDKRESYVLTNAVRGVAPHHGALTRIERHIVEKWIRNRKLTTIVATQGLAESTSIPFDLSVVAFTQRFNSNTGRNEPLSTTEIRQMLGRAGQVGEVSDGICLLVEESKSRSPSELLDQNRNYFFRDSPATGYLGLRSLLARAISTHIEDPNWLKEWSGLEFEDSKNLINLLIHATQNTTNTIGGIVRTLLAYPTMADYTESQIRMIAQPLDEFLRNLYLHCDNDLQLISAIANTGLPPEFIKQLFRAIIETPELSRFAVSEQWEWADQTIQTLLPKFATQTWYKDLFDEIQEHPRHILTVLKEWRTGVPITLIEQNWPGNKTSSHIKVGELLNRHLSTLVHFWGAIGDCYGLLYPSQEEDISLSSFRQLMLYGVSTVEQYEWLHVLGGIDRVIAHRLATFMPSQQTERRSVHNEIYRRFQTFAYDRSSLATIPDDKLRTALISIIDDHFDRT